MVHVAQEMERENFRVPLLIGGATTSRAHTAVKIAPHYKSSTVHVLDASRAVGVVSKLSNPKLAKSFDEETRRITSICARNIPQNSTSDKLLTIAQARANRTAIDWNDYQPPKPDFLGMRVYSSIIPSEVEGSRRESLKVASRDPSTPLRSARDDGVITLQTLIPFIDWSPFFHTWELRGRYPAIFDDSYSRQTSA